MKNKNYPVVWLGMCAILGSLGGLYKTFTTNFPSEVKIISFIILTTCVISGFFLMQYKEWARIFFVFLLLMLIILIIVKLFFITSQHSLFDDYLIKASDFRFIFYAIGIVFMLYYLTRSKFKQLFK